MNPTGAHLPNRVMASRHSTGFTYSLARNMSMRLECAICSRGAEFPRTFPQGVFPLRPDVRDSPTAPRLTTYCRSSVLSWWTADTPSLPWFSHCTRYEVRFRWTLQYFCILQGQLLSNSSSDKLCAVSSYIGFSSDSCLLARFAQGGISLNSAMIFFSLQSQLLLPRHERGSLAWESGLLTNQLVETAHTCLNLNILFNG